MSRRLRPSRRLAVAVAAATAWSAVASTPPRPADAAEAAAPAALVQVVGRIDGRPGALAWQGATLLAGLGPTLAAYDLAPDGRATRRLPDGGAALGLDGPITGLWPSGAQTYVRAGGRLHVVDVADLAAPQPLATIDAADPAAVVPLGDRLWVVAHGRLSAHDVSDPRAPRRLGEAVSDIAFTALGGRPGRLVAVGYRHPVGPWNPYAPVPVVAATFDPAGAVTRGPLGEVAIGGSGYGRANTPLAVAVVGDAAVVASAHGSAIGFAGIVIDHDTALGLQSVDVSDPARPTVVTYPPGVGVPTLWADGPAAVAAAAGGAPERLWAAVRRGPRWAPAGAAVAAFDLTAPLSPTLRLYDLPSPATALAAAGERVAAVDITGTLHHVLHPPGMSPARPAPDVLVDAVAVDVDAVTGRAVVAHRGRGLQVVDAVEPTRPRTLSEVRTPGGADGARDVAWRDAATAVVADGPAGVVVVGGLDGAAAGAAVVAQLAAAGDVRALAVAGGVAYAVGTGGLSVVDVSRPASPTLLARVPAVGSARSVAVAAGAAFVATDAGALVAVDVADPAAPAVHGPVADVAGARDVAADGDTVVVAAGDGGLVVVAAADKAARGALAGGSRVTAVAARDGTAFLAGPGGLQLADVTDPAAPRWLAARALPGVGDGATTVEPSGVAEAGGRVFVAAGPAGVPIVAAAVGPSVRQVYLPLAMRGFRHTGVQAVACAPEADDARPVRQPAVAPDGRTLVCTDGGALYTGPLDGGPADAIPFGALPITAVETPVVSPDGRRIAFGCLVSGVWHVCDVASGGFDARSLTAGALPPGWHAQRPSLSPDGRRLAFDAAPPDAAGGVSPASDIYVLDLATRAVARLTDDPAPDRFPSFFPDGRALVFRSERDGNSELYRVGVDGTGLRRLTDDPAYDAYATVSPDGRTVAYQSSRTGRDGVHLLDLSSGAVRDATDGLRAYREPRFTPDGRALVALAYDEGPGGPGDGPSGGHGHTVVRLPVAPLAP